MALLSINDKIDNRLTMDIASRRLSNYIYLPLGYWKY